MSHLRIGQLLVQAGLVTEDQLAEALTAQQIYGGRLGTVLIEHDFVDEDELAEALARQHGMRRVGRDHLANIAPAVIAAVPVAVATRFQAVPFALEDERNLVWLAIPDPADLARQDELQFALGRPVELALAPEILLKRALAKYYGLAHQRRFIKLHTDSARKRRRRPVSAEHAVLDAPQMLRLLADAAAQSAVLDRSLDCLATFAEQVVLLTLDEQGLAGWGSRGEFGPAGPTATQRIAFDSAPGLRDLLAAKRPVLLDGETGAELRSVLARHLGFDAQGKLALLTLTVGDRTLGCFALGRLRRDRRFDPALVAELVMRISWRLQALHLMDCVTAPLQGTPS